MMPSRPFQALFLAAISAPGALGQSAKVPSGRPIVLNGCSILPIEDKHVSVKVSGVLSEVKVEKGDVVKKDDLLAKVEDMLARVELEKKTAAALNKSTVLSAEARRKEALAQRDDAKKLFATRNLSEEEYRVTEAKLELAIHGVHDEEVKLHLASIEQTAAEEIVRRHEVRSPIDGVVIERSREQDEAVKELEPVFRIIRTDVVKVEGTVNIHEADRVRPGALLEVYPNLPLTENWRLRGHTAAIQDVKVLADGVHCASAGSDGAIIVWDAVRGVQEKILLGHDGAVQCLAVSAADPNILVSAGADGKILVWDLANGSPVQTVKVPSQDILALALSPREAGIAMTGHEDRQIRIWDLNQGKEIKRLAGHTNHITTLAMTPDGKYLFSAGNDETARLWDVETSKEIAKYRGRSSDIRRVGLSPDGSAFLFNNESHLQTRKLLEGTPVADFESREGNFTDIALFAPRGDMILTATETRQLQLWRPAPAGRYPRLVRQYDGHVGPIRAVDFAPDGGYFVSVGDDRVVHVWKIPPLDQIERERKTGTIAVVNKQAEAGSQTVEVQAKVDNSDDVFKTGYFATMVIYPDAAQSPKTAQR